jgi:hypothetical protein
VAIYATPEWHVTEDLMSKFRKNPVIIEAEQWQGDRKSFHKILAMGLKDWTPGKMGTTTFTIKTLEGDHLAKKGDWIVKDVKGEFYLVKPDIFEQTYEPAK